VIVLVAVLPWQFDTATIEKLAILVQEQGDLSDSTTHVGYMTLDHRRNHQKIPAEDDDFSITDDALAEAEDTLIVHIVEKRVTGYRPAMNYTGTHQVTQRQGMGQGQNISATKIP
jgi:hypothetical protein